MHTDIYFVEARSGANIDPQAVQKLAFSIGRADFNIEDDKGKLTDTGVSVERFPLFFADVENLDIVNVELANPEFAKSEEELSEVTTSMTEFASELISDLAAFQITNHDLMKDASLTEVVEVFALGKTLAVAYQVMKDEFEIAKKGKMNLQAQINPVYNTHNSSIN